MLATRLLLVFLLALIVSAFAVVPSAAQTFGQAEGEGESQEQTRKDKKAKTLEDLDQEIWNLMDVLHATFGEGKTWYDLFEVGEDATAEAISKTYRHLSRKYHPDKNPDDASAAKTFQALGSVARILREPNLRKRYDHWLVNEIPFWRRGNYMYRKSESLSVLESVVVMLFGFAGIQYVAMCVTFVQVKKGLALWESYRAAQSLSRKSGTSSTPITGKQNSKRQRKRQSSSDRFAAPGAHGLFDDANRKKAMEWLVLGKGMTPEAVVDASLWERTVDEQFAGSAPVAAFPRPWDTFLVRAPVGVVKGAVGVITGLFAGKRGTSDVTEAAAKKEA